MSFNKIKKYDWVIKKKKVTKFSWFLSKKVKKYLI